MNWLFSCNFITKLWVLFPFITPDSSLFTVPTSTNKRAATHSCIPPSTIVNCYRPRGLGETGEKFEIFCWWTVFFFSVASSLHFLWTGTGTSLAEKSRLHLAFSFALLYLFLYGWSRALVIKTAVSWDKWTCHFQLSCVLLSPWSTCVSRYSNGSPWLCDCFEYVEFFLNLPLLILPL